MWIILGIAAYLLVGAFIVATVAHMDTNHTWFDPRGTDWEQFGSAMLLWPMLVLCGVFMLALKLLALLPIAVFHGINYVLGRRAQ